ncbi:phosphotransferase family protein [Phycisphaerales bacterium AB-hyl4]|uniref:Phosphotransferase family protein n=1 Tax=Natronomicrosphaera hydrolytica TaxID=3242702 RepID=A0ABV4U393_9BACT
MNADSSLDGTVAGQTGSVDVEASGLGYAAGRITSAGPIANGNGDVATPLPSNESLAHQPAALPHSDHDQSKQSLLGTSLAPVLLHVCQGRLTDLHWFRTDWQRGGAVTGYATYADDDGQPHDVVVKMPVPPCERHWLAHLGEVGEVAPRVFAHGEMLGGYDLAWVVMERLTHGPLGPQWNGREFDLLAEAAGRFYAASRNVPLAGDPMLRDWDAVYERARKAVRDSHVPQAQRWRTVLKKAHRKLNGWLKQWHDRPIEDWCHGDLHLGNAMTRDPAPDGPALLFDFAHTRVGHWVEDAVYFEHLFWARRDRLNGRKVCRLIAQQRKQHGLPVGSDWPALAQIKRNLLAISAPAQLVHHGDPLHLHAALDVLEASAA